MNRNDFQMAAKRVKDCMRGVSPQQVGDMKIEESDSGCDLVVQYTKAPRFTENGQILTLGIHFNNADEANHARNILRYGEADLDMPSDTSDRRYDTPFNVNL